MHRCKSWCYLRWIENPELWGQVRTWPRPYLGVNNWRRTIQSLSRHNSMQNGRNFCSKYVSSTRWIWVNNNPYVWKQFWHDVHWSTFFAIKLNASPESRTIGTRRRRNTETIRILWEKMAISRMVGTLSIEKVKEICINLWNKMGGNSFSLGQVCIKWRLGYAQNLRG